MISPIPNETENPKPTQVVCAIIECEGSVLLAKRPAHKHLGGKWEFPGGKVESGETPSDALVREIAEELGCDFIPHSELPHSVYHYEKITIEMIPFIGRLVESSSPPQCHEHEAIVWARREELKTYDLAPADYPILETYLKTLPPPS